MTEEQRSDALKKLLDSLQEMLIDEIKDTVMNKGEPERTIYLKENFIIIRRNHINELRRLL